MRPPTNNWRQTRTEHRPNAETATDFTTRNPERKDTQPDNTKNKKDEQHRPQQKNWG